jgi:uncharacterized membrane protein
MTTQYTSDRHEKTAEQRGEPQRPSVSAGLPRGAQPSRPGSAQLRTQLRTPQESNGRRAMGPTHPWGVPLARTLGWFSIGLGLAEVMAPRALARLIGVSGEHRMLLRLFGLREMASGVGILTQHRPAPWMWGRVGGDALDLACLGAALTSDEARPGRIAAAMAAVAGVTALDVLCSQQISESAPQGQGRRAEYSVMINRAPADLYRFWRDFQNLPRFMPQLRSVRVDTERHSHWIAQGPAETTLAWDAEIIDDQPDTLIAWRSLAGADVDHAGSVRFEAAPGGRGTVVRVCRVYHPPGGALGTVVATLFGEDPEQHMHEGLRRFKQLMEAGETATTSGQPSART